MLRLLGHTYPVAPCHKRPHSATFKFATNWIGRRRSERRRYHRLRYLISIQSRPNDFLAAAVGTDCMVSQRHQTGGLSIPRRGSNSMWNYRRAASLAATLAAGGLVLAACGGGGDSSTTGTSSGPEFNVSTTRVINPNDATGGTLRLGGGSDCDSWDPQRAYYGACWNMQRLYARKLVDFGSFDPANATALEPDLATGLGEPNADFTQFTYHLKDGIKFEDGSPITIADFKYSLKRLYATDVINGGPNSYFLCLLSDCADGVNPDYKGAYKDPSGEPMVKGKPAIETPDDKTVVFHLTQPYASFDYLAAMGPLSPIPQAVDETDKGGENYTQNPVSSGPYEVSEYDRDDGLHFGANDQWDQATDTIRKPKVDTVTIEYVSNLDDLDQRLKAGTLDARFDGDIQPTFQAEALADPTQKQYVDDPIDGALQYLSILPQVEPLDDVHCRRAIFYAVNKQTYLLAYGGANNGEIAHTLTPAGLPGYTNDPAQAKYPNGADFTGDLTKAKEELSACGKPAGFETNFAFVSQGTGPQRASVLQEALARIGITVNLKPGEAETYYSEYIGSTRSVEANQLGIAMTGWGADYPTSNGFWFALADGEANQPTSDTNYPDLDDPAVNALMDQSLSAPRDQWDTIGRNLDNALMDAAVFVPMIHSKSVYWRNQRLTNVYSTQFFGFYDWVNVGISDGQ